MAPAPALGGQSLDCSVLEAEDVPCDGDGLVTAAGVRDFELHFTARFTANCIGPTRQRLGGHSANREQMSAGEELSFGGCSWKDAANDDAVFFGFDDDADTAVGVGPLNFELLLVIGIAITHGQALHQGCRRRDGSGENERAQHEVSCGTPTE